MKDSVDTTTRWTCPFCAELLETDFAQMQCEINVHLLKCPNKKEDKDGLGTNPQRRNQ